MADNRFNYSGINYQGRSLHDIIKTQETIDKTKHDQILQEKRRDIIPKTQKDSEKKKCESKNILNIMKTDSKET
jgi:hypothetical protein